MHLPLGGVCVCVVFFFLISQYGNKCKDSTLPLGPHLQPSAAKSVVCYYKEFTTSSSGFGNQRQVPKVFPSSHTETMYVETLHKDSDFTCRHKDTPVSCVHDRLD